MIRLHRWTMILVIVLLHQVSSAFGIEQVQAGKDGVMALDKDNDGPYTTWYNRRLHTFDIWAKNDLEGEELGEDKWYTIQFFMDGPSWNDTEESSVIFSWNVHSTKRTAFTYMSFVNEPLGPEHVRYEITTSFFDLINASTPVNTSEGYTKYTFNLNATHIMLWVNDVWAVKLFLREIPLDLGNTKHFKFENFDTTRDLFKIYYWDPTVFCWTDCYDDGLPDKFHFDRDNWDPQDGYSKKEIGDQCNIVNCTADMLDKPEPEFRSEFARCVRLYHTPQGESKQKVLLKCTNENYTYTACEAFPDKPCWYEVCDNYDLCNSARPASTFLSLPLLVLFCLTTSRLLLRWGGGMF